MDELADAGSVQTLQNMSLVSAAATKETLHEVLDALRRIRNQEQIDNPADEQEAAKAGIR